MAKWMTGPINFGQKKDRRPNPSREDLDLPSFQMREMIDKEGTERMYPDPGGPDLRLSISARNHVREVCRKSKWKFKMAFAMKGGGVSRGSRLPLSYLI